MCLFGESFVRIKEIIKKDNNGSIVNMMNGMPHNIFEQIKFHSAKKNVNFRKGTGLIFRLGLF